jgi:hypothetical protein
MSKGVSAAYKHRPAKWVLHFVLIFSALTFSGQSFTNALNRYSPAQTEVVSETREKKQGVAFTTPALAHPHVNPYTLQAHHLLRAYATVLKTKIIHQSKQASSLASCNKAITFQYAPRLAIDIIATFVRG